MLLFRNLKVIGGRAFNKHLVLIGLFNNEIVIHFFFRNLTMNGG
jgi:hypothetical protein